MSFSGINVKQSAGKVLVLDLWNTDVTILVAKATMTVALQSELLKNYQGLFLCKLSLKK